MRALAGFIMGGRMQAVLVAAGFAVLGLMLPPVGYLSGAAVGLVTLRKGGAEGLLVAAGAVAGSAVLVLLVLGSPAPALGFALGLWLPLWALALVWRATVSLPLTIQAAAGLSALFVVLMHLILPDPAVWWRSLLETLRPVMEQAGMLGEGPEVDVALERVAGMMTGVVGAALVLSLMISLLIARWWQAVLYNPGGFGAEFRSLRLDRRFGLALLAAFGLSVFVPGALGALAGDLAIVAMVAFVFQGLALIHGSVAAVQAHRAWLIGVYVMIVLAPPQAALVLAAMGFADTWFDFRARMAGAGGPGGGST
jgi:hypothetical protein